MRKATGIVRKIDNLGRIVVPVEMRKVLGVDKGDQIEIYVEGNEIILKKYQQYNKYLSVNLFDIIHEMKSRNYRSEEEYELYSAAIVKIKEAAKMINQAENCKSQEDQS